MLLALLALAAVPRAPAAWLGRLDPGQVTGPGLPQGTGARGEGGWPAPGAPGLPGGQGASESGGRPSPPSSSVQLLGAWYVVAVASGEKGFAVEKATKNMEGVVVTLTPENKLKVLASRHR